MDKKPINKNKVIRLLALGNIVHYKVTRTRNSSTDYKLLIELKKNPT